MYTPDYSELVDKIKKSLQRNSKIPLDLSDYSFISQLINVIAAFDDNILFYLQLAMNEMSFDSAILPETVLYL